ncbi:MAG: hypothetical protein BGN88_11055 [Clostridiales bacterium 43-6]|nr:MAG: hypothetical protein BGN88_11055 [Clostridiales bacterium 43-6]
MKKYHNRGGFILVLSVSLFYALFTCFVVWGITLEGFSNGAIQFLILEILSLILAIALVVFFFRRMSRKTAAKNAFLTLPEQTAQVKVVSKSKKTVGDRYSTGSIFYITFEMPDGDRKNFQVIHDSYATIEKDDMGTLTYKEGDGYKFFVHFTRNVGKD